MRYLIDTDRAADWLKGRTEAVSLLDRISADGLAMSLMSVGELYEGVYFGRDQARAERALKQLLRTLDVLPLNITIMRAFARIRGGLRAQGLIIDDLDILIGATAIYHDLIVVTRNVRHSERIPGIALFRPT